MKSWAMAAVLGVFSVGVPQEPASDVESLLKRLEEGSGAAENELIRLGPAVAPAVRKRMPTSPRDAWIRLDRVLQRIETSERRRRFRAGASPVSFKVEGKPFADVLPELEKIVGVPLGPAETLKPLVTVDLKDICPLEALDRVCASANIAWHAQWTYRSPQLVPSVIFRGIPETPSKESVKYVKGFRITMPRMGIDRRRTPFSDEAMAWVGGVLQPPPASGHVHLDGLRIDRIVDDRGEILYEGKAAGPGTPRRPQRLAGAAQTLGHISLQVSVKPPGPEARSFSILGAVAEVRAEVERRHVALEAAESALGRSVEFEGLTLTLESLHKADKKLVIGVAQKGRRKPVESSDTLVDVEGLQLEFAVLRLRNGSTIHAERVDRPFGREGRAEHVFATSEEPAEIRFITYTAWERETLAFEFRDVPISGGGR